MFAYTDLDTALWRAWQGDLTHWRTVRQRLAAVANGPVTPDTLMLVLAEEAVPPASLTPDQQRLDAYLFEITRERLQAGQFSMADGVAPVLVHFARRRSNGQFTHPYDRQLLDLTLPLLDTTMNAHTVNFSLDTGLAGALLALGTYLPPTSIGNRFWPHKKGIEHLLQTYVRLLQRCKFPIDMTYGPFVHFPERISWSDDLWDEPAQTNWATGDLGQALFLARCGYWLAKPELIRWAVRVATHSIFRRKRDDLPTPNVGIRHGAAGLMLLYQCLYSLTQEPVLQQEAIFWQQQVRELLPTLDATHSEHPLLEGLMGIRIALLALDDTTHTLNSLLL